MPAPIHQPVPLNVTMSPEVPTGFTGVWATDMEQHVAGARWSSQYNRTIPTIHGPVSNYIQEISSPGMFASVFNPWSRDAPLSGVVNGCTGRCRTAIKAPALFPISCVSREVSISPGVDYNLTAVIDGIFAPPINHEYFFISINIGLREQEVLYINTAFASKIDSECSGTLNSTVCTLKAGIGYYEVTVENDKIMMDSIGAPSFAAYANNTPVDNTVDPSLAGHKSTLAGIGSLIEYRWGSFLAYFRSKSSDVLTPFVYGPDALAPFASERSGNSSCAITSDPHNLVIGSINKLMLYTGAFAAQEDHDYLASHLDPGLSSHDNITGHVLGSHDVYCTDYWFFLAAALVELFCIMLVAPTYWGWWNLPRPVCE